MVSSGVTNVVPQGMVDIEPFHNMNMSRIVESPKSSQIVDVDSISHNSNYNSRPRNKTPPAGGPNMGQAGDNLLFHCRGIEVPWHLTFA